MSIPGAPANDTALASICSRGVHEAANAMHGAAAGKIALSNLEVVCILVWVRGSGKYTRLFRTDSEG